MRVFRFLFAAFALVAGWKYQSNDLANFVTSDFDPWTVIARDRDQGLVGLDAIDGHVKWQLNNKARICNYSECAPVVLYETDIFGTICKCNERPKPWFLAVQQGQVLMSMGFEQSFSPLLATLTKVHARSVLIEVPGLGVLYLDEWFPEEPMRWWALGTFNATWQRTSYVAVVANNASTLRGVDISTGNVMWKADNFRDPVSTPWYVFAFSTQNDLLYALNGGTGIAEWSRFLGTFRVRAWDCSDSTCFGLTDTNCVVAVRDYTSIDYALAYLPATVAGVGITASTATETWVTVTNGSSCLLVQYEWPFDSTLRVKQTLRVVEGAAPCVSRPAVFQHSVVAALSNGLIVGTQNVATQTTSVAVIVFWAIGLALAAAGLLCFIRCLYCVCCKKS